MPHEILGMGVIDFSFSFQLWQTARQFEVDKKASGSGNAIKPKTDSSKVEVLREPSKVLRW